MFSISYTSGLRDTSYPTFLPDCQIQSPSVVVEIESATSFDYTVAGWLTPVFGSGDNAIEGQGVKAILGRKLYDFSPPGYPYHLKFRSKPYLRPWNIRVYRDSQGYRPRIVRYAPSLSPTLVLDVRGDRLGASMRNLSGSTIYVGFHSNLAPGNAIDYLLPNGQWILDGKYIGKVWMLADRIGDPVTVVEYAKNPFS